MTIAPANIACGQTNGCVLSHNNQGDTLAVYGVVSTTNTLDGSSGASTGNYITIQRVGN